MDGCAASPPRRFCRKAAALLLALPAFLGSIGWAAAETDPAVSADLPSERRDAITILSNDSGGIRKWSHSPEVVVIYRDHDVKAQFEAVLEQIRTGAPNFVGFAGVSYFDLGTIEGDFHGKILTRLQRTGEGDEERSTFGMRVAAGRDGVQILSGNIFIFALDADELMLMGSLTSASASYVRRVERGLDPVCWYKSHSRSDTIQIAFVYIYDSPQFRHIKECLYEELIQSLGLLNDANCSPHFTLDDGLGGFERRRNDLRLLDRLYDTQFPPGSPAARVADAYMEEN